MKEPRKIKNSFKFNTVEQTKVFANRQEKIIAKDIGGKRTVNSGSLKFMPGDIYLGDNFIDVKSAKTSKQVIVTEDMLEKLENQASMKGKNPVLLLNFPNAEKLRNKRWVLVPVGRNKL